jgi:HD-GYP domain-containing protein (c-di-GMP phosphodiesterase class II)
MLRVPISMAKPGMTLALPVYHPRRHDTVLLHQGMMLDERSIRRLREIHLRQLWIHYPGVEFVCEYICPTVFESQAALTWQIGRALELVSQGAFARLEYAEYRSAIAAVLGRLIANPRAAVFIQEMVGRDEPVLRHASNVCLTSILMGLKLDDYLVQERSRLGAQSARDVSSLGVGAMLHDVGMLRLDPGAVQRWNFTLDETDPEWRRHVQVGYELVKDAIGPSAAAGVLHHHQKFDGSGFPKRQLLSGLEEALSGSDIHVFARIIGCADLFDRLRHPPGADPESPAVPVVRVLNRLRAEPFVRWVDPMVYKALLAVIPAYAPGTMVTLSNGVQGVVTQWFPDDPCRPTVQELGEIKREGPRTDAPSRRFILREEPDISVAISEGQDVGEDNFYPSIPGEFDLRLAGRALHNQAAKRPLTRVG